MGRRNSRRDKIDQVAPNKSIYIFMHVPCSTRETLKTFRNAKWIDLRCVYVFRCFAFSSFSVSGTVVAKNIIFLFFVTAPKTSRNLERTDLSKSNGRQNRNQNRPSGVTMKPFPHPLASNWLPFPSLLLWLSMCPHAYSTDLWTEHCKNCKCFFSDLQLQTSFRQSAKICPDLPRSAKFEQRSNKIIRRIAKHKPPSATGQKRITKTPSPKIEGAAVSRRMASSIKWHSKSSIN